jgi:hypothetical protein
MAHVSAATTADCIALVLNALATAHGDHAVIRSGEIPVLVLHDHRYPLTRTPVPHEAVVEIAEYLLPIEEQRALEEIGETRYRMPHQMGSADFIVDVIDRDGEFSVDIERREHRWR